ncbi:MAG TPA: hypothetical protein VHG51_07690 [Longimicrobiaceae bacterium]|nr:hypothetical protein [Longimicrobiaceae bacterium]
MSATAEAAPARERWSAVNRDFREWVERNPEFLRRDRFAAVCEDPALRKLSLQPWPLFIDAVRLREVERLTLAMDRLVKSVFERFLDDDPERIAEYYRSARETPSNGFELSEELVMLMMEEPSGIAGAPSRGDYVETDRGLVCIEFNCGGGLGGLPNNTIAERHLAGPALSRFLAERGLRARGPDTLGALFRHCLDDTARLGAWDGGEFNVAILVRPHDDDQVALTDVELCTRELRRVLEERAAGRATGGAVVACGPEDLVEDGSVLRVEGRPVHVVVEQHDGSADMRAIFRHFKRGRLNLFSGPISVLLGDKRNLALVSEHAGSAEFSAAERELIAAHVPWTRRVLPGRTELHGRTVRLPDDLPELRGQLVLKRATSLGGRHVHIGRFCTDDEWRALLALALREEDWVVQEYLDPVPCVFQRGEEGAARFDTIWGLFAFGDQFGGGFLRVQPRSGEHAGVVNTAQGAEVGILLEVAD